MGIRLMCLAKQAEAFLGRYDLRLNDIDSSLNLKSEFITKICKELTQPFCRFPLGLRFLRLIRQRLFEVIEALSVVSENKSHHIATFR